MLNKKLIGKTIKSIETGKYGMAQIAFCMNFTDGTCITIAGEHDENTIIIDGNLLDETTTNGK